MAKKGGSKPAKGILYLLSRFAILVVIIIIVVIAFFAAMNTVNINMVAKDALSLRAEVVLANDAEKTDQLNNFFTDDFLGKDALLYESPYDSFKITNYYHRVDVHSSVVWPWQTEVTVSVDDIITDISGHEIVQAEEDAQIEQSLKKPPAWQNGVYELKMVKMGDVWKIRDISFVKVIDTEPSASPTSESSASQEVISEEPHETEE